MAAIKIDLVVDDKGSVVVNKVIGDMGKLDHVAGKLNNSFGSLQTSMAKIGGLLAGAISVAGIVQMGRSALETMDNLDEMSQKVGVNTTTLQVFSHMAKLSGSDLDGVSKAIGIMSKNLLTMEMKGEDTNKAFQTLGISVKDSSGNMKSADTLLVEIADKFKNLADGSQKTALSMMLFGKSGKDLIPTLNQGGEGIKEMHDRLERLGILIDENTIRAAGEFNDRLEEIGMMSKGLAMRVMGELSPALDELAKSFLENDKTGELMRAKVETIATVIKSLASVAIGVVAAFDLMGTAIGEGVAMAAHAIRQLPAALMGGNVEVWSGGSSFEKKLNSYAAMIDAFWKKNEGGTKPKKKKGRGDLDVPDPAKIKQIEQIEKQMQKEIDKLTLDEAAQIENQAQEWRDFGVNRVKVAEWTAAKIADINQKEEDRLLKIQYDSIDKEYQRRAKGEEEFQRLWAEEADFAINMNEREMAKIIRQEAYKLVRITELHKEGIIGWEQYEMARTRITENATQNRIEKQVNEAKRVAEINYQLIENIVGMEKEAFALRLDLIEAEKNKQIKDGGDVVRAEKWAKNEQLKAMIALGKKGGNVADGMKAALSQVYLDQMTLGQAAFDVTMGFHSAMSDSFGSMIYGMKDGLNSFTDYWVSFTDSMWRSFSNAVAKMIADWVFAMDVMSSGSGGGSGGLFGGGGGLGSMLGLAGGIASNFIPGGSMLGLITGGLGMFGGAAGSGMGWTALLEAGGLFHEGGIVGTTPVPTRSVPAYLFDSAPRYHRGLRNDEMPAILQKGETVIPKGKSAASPVVIHIHPRGHVLTTKELARELVPAIKKAMKEGAH